MNIVRGKIITPPKVILYGPEGIGKSTFASKFPKPLFLDIEGGTNRLDVDRINVGAAGYTTVLHTISQLTADNKGYQTLVIDTADWLDSLITEKICQKAGKQGIEDFGYGKGFVYVKEEWGRLLDSLTVIQSVGICVRCPMCCKRSEVFYTPLVNYSSDLAISQKQAMQFAIEDWNYIN